MQFAFQFFAEASFSGDGATRSQRQIVRQQRPDEGRNIRGHRRGGQRRFFPSGLFQRG
ncbi:MAG: hypothetical protein U0X75_13155 [Acidobacteriota bacterium]